MIRYTPTEAGQTEPLTGPEASADGMGELYAREAEMDQREDRTTIDEWMDWTPPMEPDGTVSMGIEKAAPGTEPIRQNRDTPPRHVRWLIAGAGLGFILGMGAMEVLGG